MAETTLLRSSAIVRNTAGKQDPQLSGQHKTVHVNMNAGGAQSIQGGGSQLSQQQAQANKGVTILPPKGGTRTFTTGNLPNQGAKPNVLVFQKDQRGTATPAAALTADQLLLCRHLADKYLGELRAAVGEAQPDEATTNNIKLAEATIAAVDATMAALTAAAAAAAVAVAAPPPRAVAAGSRSVQAATAAPRRVVRSGPVPPPVAVKMDGKVAIVQDPAAESAPQQG